MVYVSHYDCHQSEMEASLNWTKLTLWYCLMIINNGNNTGPDGRVIRVLETAEKDSKSQRLLNQLNWFLSFFLNWRRVLPSLSWTCLLNFLSVALDLYCQFPAVFHYFMHRLQTELNSRYLFIDLWLIQFYVIIFDWLFSLIVGICFSSAQKLFHFKNQFIDYEFNIIFGIGFKK